MFEHVQFVNIILTIALAAGSAWGATKVTIKVHEKTLKKHEESIKELEKSIKGLVPASKCKEARSECRADRETMTCELSRKMDRLFDAVADQDRKRELGKDKNNAMFTEILTHISALEERSKKRRRVDQSEDD